MSTIATELIENTDAIVQRWYEILRRSPQGHPEISEAALKDKLPLQLRVIGEQLREVENAESTAEIWKVLERLDPEERVDQGFPIEEVVLGYRLAVETVREWIAERAIDVSFREYAYFYNAMFELTAEAVRRYSEYQAKIVRDDRAEHLASVMHQLRTPLSTLAMQVGMLDAARNGLDPSFVARLNRSVHRVRTLCEHILRLERFHPAEIPVNPVDVPLEAFVAATIDDHRAAAVAKGLRLEAQFDSSLQMHTDPDLLTDALGNLVQNAVKFTREGSIVVDVEATNGAIVFHVRDSGDGIAPDVMKSLFAKVLPGEGGGAGIGLRIACHSAQALGGSIDVESTVGRGSTFSLRVPRTVAARAGHVGARG